MLPIEYWIVVGATVIAVIICVVLHYEGLRFMSDNVLPRIGHRRPMIVVMILWLVLLHVSEIWIFGFTYWSLLNVGEYGHFTGVPINGFLDCVYFSATVFTTLGFGDIVPFGPIRFVTGTEAVVGLTLITWSASYTFLEMMKTWNSNGD